MIHGNLGFEGHSWFSAASCYPEFANATDRSFANVVFGYTVWSGRGTRWSGRKQGQVKHEEGRGTLRESVEATMWECNNIVVMRGDEGSIR